MAGSKRVGMLAVGTILWAGLCLLGPQTPLAGERQAAKPSDREARALPPAGSVDLRCQVEQPMTILSVIPPGKSVKKGDLLVELDASALMDRRMQQAFQTRKAEADVARAKRSQQTEEQAGLGHIDLAERALRLAQGQRKAFTAGEYPHQLALAEGAAALADEKRKMLEDRVAYLRHAAETPKEEAAQTSRQEAELALQEAKLQSYAATDSLALLKSIVHDNKVAELDLIVVQKEFELARDKTVFADANMQCDIAISLTKMSRTMESDRLARLDDQIVKSKIYAPWDGTVAYPDDTGKAESRPGAVARPRQVLIRLLPVTPPKP